MPDEADVFVCVCLKFW